MMMTIFVLFANDINIMAGPKSGGREILILLSSNHDAVQQIRP